MTEAARRDPLRILIAALGGEGGGTLMNWIVDAARNAGHVVQATSVPGVAQRTGSTTYYIEIAALNDPAPVLSLNPMPGRVDVVLSSELVETARVLAAGFVSPKRTLLISSTARQLTTAEKIQMGDGRYTDTAIKDAAQKLSKANHLLDLTDLATRHRTFVSATMYGALAGAGVLPWPVETSRAVLGDGRSAEASRAGFDAALAAVAVGPSEEAASAEVAAETPDVPVDLKTLPEDLQNVVAHGIARCVDYQDQAYGKEYLERARLLFSADLTNHHIHHAVTEACRRLALWMTYEDVARVADLKTRPDRFERIRRDARIGDDQLLTVTEFLKPRAEEIADILPQKLGARLMARVEAGKGLPFTGRGLHVRSNGVVGYRLLRSVAGLRSMRRRSYRFGLEQAAIEEWLGLLRASLDKSPEFASALAELPRVLKGYSDTLVRGRRAYAMIMESIVRPASASQIETSDPKRLRAAIAAALSDETHAKLVAALGSAEGGSVLA